MLCHMKHIEIQRRAEPAWPAQLREISWTQLTLQWISTGRQGSLLVKETFLASWEELNTKLCS